MMRYNLFGKQASCEPVVSKECKDENEPKVIYTYSIDYRVSRLIPTVFIDEPFWQNSKSFHCGTCRRTQEEGIETLLNQTVSIDHKKLYSKTWIRSLCLPI